MLATWQCFELARSALARHLVLSLFPFVPADAESLRHRVALEQARVGELEGLLALARADQVGLLSVRGTA